MEVELKPCPFCGGEAAYHTDSGPTGEVYGWVGCNQCDAMSCHIDVRSMQPEETHPIDAWNTRAEQAAELAKFKALAETLAGALEPVERLEMWSDKAADNDVIILTVGTIRKMREALTSYKEQRDA